MFTLNCNGKLIIADHPLVMGILNITSDSFYTGSQFTNSDTIIKAAEKMLSDGADILDIGGQTTKPGSVAIDENDEIDRTTTAIKDIIKHFPQAVISIDTYRSKVALAAINEGACIVNDISGGELDNNMISTIGTLAVPYICMHMKGTPENMAANANYDDIIKEVLNHFILKTQQCQDAGIKDLIIDPGFGFSKNIEQNFKVLKHLELFKMLDRPILVGLSRKSTIYKTLNVSANEALNGTTVLNTIALQNGADILRVHDVKEAKEAIKLFTAYNQSSL